MNDRVRAPRADRYILAGDVGGTKTILGLYPYRPKSDQASVEKTYASQDYADLESIIESFVSETDGSVVRASFAVAGPVFKSYVRVTNLPWEVNGPRIAHRFGFDRTVLMNDAEAIAQSIPHLSPLDLLTLHPGEQDPYGPIAVLAPGTGFGEAYLTWNGESYDAHSSEGGHADFAPTDDLQSELLAFLREELGHVSVERVGSGSGIPNVYRFLRDHHGMEEPTELAERLAHNDDPMPIIVSAAVDLQCALCQETLRTFVSILGAEAGNLALKLLATGGIYLGGGLPPRTLPFLQDDRFLTAIRAKGRFEPLLKRIPVHVILNPRAALLGAMRLGLQDLDA
jgi:glucokinase